ncbi:MAG: hypothetical protein SGJ17_06065 [Hyphomicrobiales bacterium]|nr:hypothetical protein [Hyphomicrobiales bacterium]
MHSTDALFIRMNISFAHAVEYDDNRLAALAVRSVSPGASYQGPMLRTVLVDAGATYNLIHLYGLDGNFTLDQGQVNSANWIIAMHRNGRWLGLGGHGPLMLTQEPPGATPSPVLSSLFYIEVK